MQDLKSCLMSAERSAVADGRMSYSAVQLSCVYRFLQENIYLGLFEMFVCSAGHLQRRNVAYIKLGLD